MTAAVWSVIGLLVLVMLAVVPWLVSEIRGVSRDLKSALDGVGTRIDAVGSRIDDGFGRLDSRLDSMAERIDKLAANA